MKNTSLPVLVISFRGAAPSVAALFDLRAAKWQVRRVHLPNGNSYVHAVHLVRWSSSWDLPFLVKFATERGGSEVLLINRGSSFVNQTGVTLLSFLALPDFTA